MGSSLSQRPGRVNDRRTASHLPRAHRPVRPNGALDRAQLISLQRLVGNKAASDLIEESRSPVLDVIARPGRSLDPALQRKMEERFGQDFSSVKIHSDAQAADSAQSVGAIAYTAGENIVLGSGQADKLRSAQGEAMLAHELAHVVQQRNGPVDGTPAPGGIKISDPGDRFERQAETVASNAMSESPPSVQTMRGSASGVASNQVTVQRLNFDKPEWDTVTSVKHSKAGGKGVLFVKGSGTPLVVKAGEDYVPENQVNASLLSLAGRSGTGLKASAPAVRRATDKECLQLHGLALDPNIGIPAGTPVIGAKGKAKSFDVSYTGTLLDTMRTGEFLNDLKANKGVLIFGFAAGKEVEELLDFAKGGIKQTKKGSFGKRKLRPGSISYMLTKEPGLMTALGRAGAADIMIGNFDRTVGLINFENVMIDLDSDTPSLSLIDNVQNAQSSQFSGYMKVWDWGLGGANDSGTGTGKEGFMAWTRSTSVGDIAARNYDAIAKRVVAGIRKRIITYTSSDTDPQIAKTFGKDVQSGGQRLRKEDTKLVEKQLKTNAPTLEKWFSDGLQEGYAALTKDFTEQTLPSIKASMQAGDRMDVATNLLARINFLGGATPDDAWDQAAQQVGQDAMAEYRAMRRNLLGPRRQGRAQNVFSRMPQGY
jgi:Domain of unknown function (DUF4157)